MFEQQLFGAWRSLGLDASPRSGGAITFCCPRCVSPVRLEVIEGMVSCPACQWEAAGDAWAVALAASRVVLEKASAASDFAALDACRIDLKNPPPKPVPVFKLCGQTISTEGNLTVISAQVKAGKSAAVGAMLASIEVADRESFGPDCFSFEAFKSKGKAVILFDTEQSPYDSYRLVKRAADRAGVNDFKANFRAYRLLAMPTKQRRAYLSAEMERAASQCGGLHSVLVDGVADLCVDPNDAEEAFGLVEELVQLAVHHCCPVVVVLHENPSQMGNAKTRGHLGSHLERKAESNLRVVKEEDVSIIYSEKCRSASIPKQHGAKFKWCDLKGMHVSFSGVIMTPKQVQKSEVSNMECEEVWAGVVGVLTYGGLRKRMMDVMGMPLRTVERKIQSWERSGEIKRSSDKIGFIKARQYN